MANKTGLYYYTKEELDEKLQSNGRFCRFMNSSQTVGTSSTIVLMGGKDFDEVGCSYSAGSITISQAGYWQLNGMARVTDTGAYYGLVGIYVNGEIIAGESLTAYANSSASRTAHGACSVFTHLSAGDVITLRVSNSHSVSNSSRTHGTMSGFCAMPD